MAVRQYIGARYVIKVYENSLDPSSAEWESGVTYEPLTMVTYLNSSYLSKKDVPGAIGNPASNPSYWVVTGAYNGQILNLQNQIDAINSAMIENILIIGNSYVGVGVTDALKADFDNSYEYTSAAAGFTPYTGHTVTFEDLLDNAITDSAFDNDTITAVIFVSAMGDTISYQEDDAAFTTNLRNTLASIRSKIATNFPNCQRIVTTLAETRSVKYNAYTSDYNSLFVVHKTFKHAMHYFDMEYIGWSGFNVMLAGSQYTLSDGYHPSALGATCIGAFIKNSYYGHVEYSTKYNLKKVNFAYTATAKINVLIRMTPDIVELDFLSVTDTVGNPVTAVNGTTLIDFEELDVPAPPCGYYWIYNAAHLVNDSNGNDVDFLKMQLGESTSNGFAKLQLIANPTASTVAAASCVLEGFSNVSYLIG